MKKTKKKVKQINWHKIITLSAAGQYIQNQLSEELKELYHKSKKSISK